jgi:branched-chain amino acid transport system permease protein
VTVELLLQAVVSGLLLGGVYGLVASGLALIFGVLRIINFAHGAVMMLAMYATYWLFALLRVDPYLSVLLTGPAFFVLGMLIQRLVIEPNRFAAEHNQLLLTLGLALVLENLALVLWQGDFRTVRPPYATASFTIGDALVEVPRLVACGGAAVVALALFAFLRLTDVGKAIRALSEEPEGAMLMGIDVARIRAVAFGIGAACVAVAGALVTPFFYVAPDVGESFNIMAFVVVVLGGMGNFLGALVGGVIVGLAESLGATLLPGSLKQLIVFGLFVLVLLFRPAGLFGGGRGR